MAVLQDTQSIHRTTQ